MQEARASSRLDNAVRTAALIVYFLAVAALFLGGVWYVFFPTGHSRVLGMLFLLISIPVMVLEANRWVRALPGILGLAVFNGLIMLSSGRAISNPSVPVPRLNTSILILFFGVTAVLSDKLRQRKLLITDRIALIVFAFSLAFWAGYTSIGSQQRGTLAFFGPAELISMGTGLLSLLFASLHRRKRRVTSALERQS